MYGLTTAQVHQQLYQMTHQEAKQGQRPPVPPQKAGDGATHGQREPTTSDQDHQTPIMVQQVAVVPGGGMPQLGSQPQGHGNLQYAQLIAPRAHIYGRTPAQAQQELYRMAQLHQAPGHSVGHAASPAMIVATQQQHSQLLEQTVTESFQLSLAFQQYQRQQALEKANVAYSRTLAWVRTQLIPATQGGQSTIDVAENQALRQEARPTAQRQQFTVGKTHALSIEEDWER